MKKIEAIIQPFKLDAVKQALIEIGVEGITILAVRGRGRQLGHREVYRGSEYDVELRPKLKIEIVLPDHRVADAMSTIAAAARTGSIGDGKIFVLPTDDAIRIRNGVRGEAAL